MSVICGMDDIARLVNWVKQHSKNAVKHENPDQLNSKPVDTVAKAVVSSSSNKGRSAAALERRKLVLHKF